MSSYDNWKTRLPEDEPWFCAGEPEFEDDGSEGFEFDLHELFEAHAREPSPSDFAA